MFDVVKFSING